MTTVSFFLISSLIIQLLFLSDTVAYSPDDIVQENILSND